MNLLTVNNQKAEKAQRFGWYQVNLELAAHTLSGYNVCQFSDGCELPCIITAGRGRFSVVMNARIARTHMLFKDVKQFWARFDGEIYEHLGIAAGLGLKMCVRMNTFSDLPWWYMMRPEGQNVFDAWDGLQFFDYTKRPLDGVPYHLENYDVTKSWGASSTDDDIRQCIARRVNIATVFQGKIPRRWKGLWVIDGDRHDLRFLDKKVRCVGLSEKATTGRQAGRDSGFIQMEGV